MIKKLKPNSVASTITSTKCSTSSLYDAETNSVHSRNRKLSFSVDETVFEHTIDDRIDDNHPNINDKVEKWLDTNDDMAKQVNHKTVLFTDVPKESAEQCSLNAQAATSAAKINCLTDSTNKLNNNGSDKKSKSSITIQKLAQSTTANINTTTTTTGREDKESDQENLNTTKQISNNNSAKIDGNKLRILSFLF